MQVRPFLLWRESHCIDTFVLRSKKLESEIKYYIATSLSRKKDHNLVRDALGKFEHTICYDWTLHGSVKSVSKERLQEVARCELQGVAEADFLVVLLPGGNGTHVELGFAIAGRKKVFLHCENSSLFEPGPQTNAFYHYPDVTCLCCPLADVVAQIHSALSHPVTL